MKIKPAILREAMVERKAPVLIYDNEGIESNFKRFRRITSEQNATWSMAVKALSRPEVFDIGREYVDGYDISNVYEWNKIKDFVDENHFIWITNANLQRELGELISEIGTKRILITINDITDYQLIRQSKAPYLIRVASSDLITQDGKSRFGLSLAMIDNLQKELLLDENFRGFHTHQGLQDHNPDLLRTMCETIRKEFSAFAGKGLIFNMGGSLQLFSDDDLLRSLNYLKDMFRIHIEPGRALFKEAGYALAPIEKYFIENDELRVFTRLSFINHLKWSKARFSGILNFSEELESIDPKTLVFEGPTCYEFDKSESIKIDSALTITIGSLILLENISGYSCEWNTGFNGVEACEVKFVGRRRRDNP